MRKEIHLIVYVILFSAVGYLLFAVSAKTKVAVVQSQVVVDEYDGMLEARHLYEKEMEGLNKKFDTQKNIFEIKRRVYDSLQNSYTAEDRQKQLYELEQLRQTAYKLGEAINKKSEEKETVLLEGVFNKINDYIERYGAENGLQVIIGTTLSGNVLYANEAIDVTENVIKGLNEEYNNGK